jgi:hypothetical protein
MMVSETLAGKAESQRRLGMDNQVGPLLVTATAISAQSEDGVADDPP